MKVKIVLLIILVVVFPIIVGLINSIDINKYINVNSSDLLSYYSTIFGIFATFTIFYLTYKKVEEKKKKEIEKKEEEECEKSKPHLVIALIKNDSECVFTLKIDGCEKNTYSSIYLYDILLSNIWVKPHNEYRITFESTGNNKIKYIDDTYEDLNDNGYPQSIYLVCEHIATGNVWLTVFKKNSYDNEYRATEPELIDWRKDN